MLRAFSLAVAVGLGWHVASTAAPAMLHAAQDAYRAAAWHAETWWKGPRKEPHA